MRLIEPPINSPCSSVLVVIVTSMKRCVFLVRVAFTMVTGSTSVCLPPEGHLLAALGDSGAQVQEGGHGRAEGSRARDGNDNNVAVRIGDHRLDLLVELRVARLPLHHVVGAAPR